MEIKVIIETNEPRIPIDNLKNKGYKNEGVVFDRRKKKHNIFSKDGNYYEFKGCDISGEKPVIKLEEYNY